MKKDIAEFVVKCVVCQQVKFKHQSPGGHLQPPEIPKWKWEDISCDFIVGLPKTKKNHDIIWALVDQLTESAHFIHVRMNMNLQ